MASASESRASSARRRAAAPALHRIPLAERGASLALSSGNSPTRARRRSRVLRVLIRTASVRYLVLVNRLIEYLRQNILIDFQGDLSVAKVRELLAGDDSRDAKALLTKLVADRKVEDMLVVLADCLTEPVQK